MEGGEDVADGQIRDIVTTETSNSAQEQSHPEPTTFEGSNEEGDYCRICRGEATDELPLFYPCKCSGSIKFVHQDCLMEWLSHSQKKYCELCKTSFRFTKLYDHTMPQTLPLPVFVRQLFLHGTINVFRWIRYFLVALVWLGWLPWSIRQVWRGLFWLADGSWALAASGSTNASPAQQHSLRNSSFSSDVASTFSPNPTQDVISTPSQMVAPVSGFLGYSPSDFLLVKLIRYMYPNLVNWSVDLVASGSSNATAFFPVSKRQPSLLSDIKYMKRLTSYQTVNNSIVDVLEGQLICLFIVTAFILVFLIREWVINQQPVADIPPLNHAQEPGAAAAGDIAFRGPARRRRQRIGEEGRPERVRRIAVPRPRRRLEATNADAGEAATSFHEAPLSDTSATEDAGAPETSSPTSEDHLEDESRQYDHSSSQEALPVVRPVLRARSSFEDAANIRRTIEEGGPSGLDPEWPGLDTFKELWNRADADPDEVLRIIYAESRQHELGWIVRQMQALQQQNDQRSQPQTQPNNTEEDEKGEEGLYVNDEQVVEVAGFAKSNNMSSTSNSSETGIQSGRRNSSTPPQNPSGSSPSSWEIPEPTGGLTGPSNPALASYPTVDAPRPNWETTDAATGVEDPLHTGAAPPVSGISATTSKGGSNIRYDPSTAIDSLADWLWQPDDYTAQVDFEPLEDDEQVVEDVNREAPFTPIVPAEVGSEAGDEAEVEEEQNPELIAAAAAAGIDLNNPEAVEDAEDLDGVLELIGLQGPIAGMVQNVIFSEFLITLTLAASVWLPYVWGKIALLLLANPFGVLVRAPLHLFSKVANTVVDISLFISGVCLYVLHFGLDFLLYLICLVHPVPRHWINTAWIGQRSLTVVFGSGTRLEKAIIGTVSGLKPDFPTFSILSHHALRAFKLRVTADSQAVGQSLTYLFHEVPLHLHDCLCSGVSFDKFTIPKAWSLMTGFCGRVVSNFETLWRGLINLRSVKLSIEAPLDTASLDYSLVRWSTPDRVIAIIIGYAFFALIGYLYMRINRLALGLKQGEKVEGVVADSLRQAGGVMKVILIIGIEMIVFPLYCGLLLDVALMPLFENVGFQSRVRFMMNAPTTALFVHWFVGTCYMFHFALFVSMCRKIMRRGVLYFIRDPDDPTFHPVRDVLERPITTQLSKIAFSGLVYGGLVILCLGGIVWVVSRLEGIFPIHWTANEPVLEFPMDLLFYNFLLPILIRSVEPSKKLNAIYDWWFRKCARWLRLTNFLFNEQRPDEQGRHIRRSWSAVLRRQRGDVIWPVVGGDRQILADDRQLETYFLQDGTFVRAPGSDSVRIPKGGQVFLEVDENNNRKDGRTDTADGPHGRNNDNFVKVYVPPMFRIRIAAFVVLIWAFAAASGIVFTIVPLSLGRRSIFLITQSDRPPNDLYAFSVGLYLCCTVTYAISYYTTCKKWVASKLEHYFTDSKEALPRLWSSVAYTSGLAYMAIAFGIILPFLFSTLVELYFVAPLHTYLTSTYPSPQPTYGLPVLPPTIHLIQTWTLGLVYLRAILRVVTNYPNPHTRAATAIQLVLRDGFWRPDVRLATRAFVLPSLVLSALLLLIPLGLGWVINASLGEDALEAKIYRYAYPGVLAVALAFYCALLLRRQVGVWRTRIRDDVYLIGERLHNFGEAQRRQKGKGRARVGDRAVSERLQIR